MYPAHRSKSIIRRTTFAHYNNSLGLRGVIVPHPQYVPEGCDVLPVLLHTIRLLRGKVISVFFNFGEGVRDDIIVRPAPISRSRDV